MTTRKPVDAVPNENSYSQFHGSGVRGFMGWLFKHRTGVRSLNKTLGKHCIASEHPPIDYDEKSALER
jgi:hypothetical protein